MQNTKTFSDFINPTHLVHLQELTSYPCNLQWSLVSIFKAFIKLCWLSPQICWSIENLLLEWRAVNVELWTVKFSKKQQILCLIYGTQSLNVVSEPSIQLLGASPMEYGFVLGLFRGTIFIVSPYIGQNLYKIGMQIVCEMSNLCTNLWNWKHK